MAVLNPVLDADVEADKAAVLDIKARMETGWLVDVLTRLSQDREGRERYEAREKWRHDYVSDVEGARDAGRDEGRQDMARQVAKNLLAMGRPADEVVAAGLSRAELDALKP